MYEIETDWKTMTAKHFEGRKAVSSPDFETFKVLYFFLCLDSLNMETLLFAFNKKRKGSEIAQVVWGLTTLGTSDAGPFAQRVESSQQSVLH